MRKKWISAGACAAVLLSGGILLAGCGQKKGEEEQEPHVIVENVNETVSYNFLPVEKGEVVLTETVRCTYKQQADQEISFAVTGKPVGKVYVKEGTRVKKGELLVELAVGNLAEQIEDLEYTIARNELVLAHLEQNEALDRSQAWVNYIHNHATDAEGNEKNLEAIGKNYQYQREDCEDALEMDRAELAKLKQEYANCHVYAPMDGMVYQLNNMLEGSTSKAGVVIMTIVDDSQCVFEMEEPELAEYFSEGDVLTMKIPSGNAAGEYDVIPYDREHWGEIQQFAVVDGLLTNDIKVGTQGTIRFVRDTRSNVLTVPTEALNVVDDKSFVYVMNEDNMREIRWVEAGLIGDTYTEIISGLAEGERVVYR